MKKKRNTPFKQKKVFFFISLMKETRMERYAHSDKRKEALNRRKGATEAPLCVAQSPLVVHTHACFVSSGENVTLVFF